MYRIGQSTDIHRFCEGDVITLGGVNIKACFGVEAHSDGDALCHAIAESILGALALGDLGTHFPDTDASNKDRSSIEILSEVVKKMEAKEYEIQNIDALILIEEPKMAPHIKAMCSNISKVLKTEASNVSIKATRGEKIGFVGRKEGVVCQCVTLLRRRNG
ncbi:2-C-methyl-D-erythritol 2,4-cyclodiphosphate synthase [Breznakia sp. PF5-3]|uniref:2-C-methyl-D-erythritol 2,4-cyclodiphosphate synthase n=1 Tax=unclassified Breznakia TaxID=2623764 RepID=UPI002406A9F8|nr:MULTISPECIES: 2-C-methyl-D-erythritol 2,4-cyclodiphosphate synthase [unclassified Breznakia]MDL2276511.1 2-C-methyl-D-erythritol 2,4-cyclodiphosphate synthase [Breznakia sp. OttesenSCG-928-G09]MDF9825808.1 2-C-methyl-D-erythritol 2,4-cyclodiphosphate synthase [Breznakia sp. PM6-1]MDF9836613.1 2-C-methyl-D-erythritol 2,4-cyclodiphosphate synthase [Breznakia sp. PF5-3]MDF9838837.1 2-C-methyl-D-erythritol 2,4-cyclodiphosphate synthase [Breznakia sp. PFB2-8]MDF9860863.1 2-C-methyl-D-erythritol 